MREGKYALKTCIQARGSNSESLYYIQYSSVQIMLLIICNLKIGKDVQYLTFLSAVMK